MKRERIFQKPTEKESFDLENNNNGLRLVSFAASNDRIISYTIFQQK